MNLSVSDFVDLIISHKVMQFGKFKTKSGLNTPYFLNTGNISTGTGIKKLSKFVVETIRNNWPINDIDNVFGPAYKGIPLCTAVASQLSETCPNITYTFNRKESKTHGEKGLLVGHHYQGNEKVIIVEDILTLGSSIRTTSSLLKSYNLKPIGAVVCIDRQESDAVGNQVISSLEKDLEFPIKSVFSIRDILGEYISSPKYLNNELIRSSHIHLIEDHLKDKVITPTLH